MGGEGASARGGEGTAPVVCRPTDKQRRYCKCIGTTRCGASLAAFLRDVTQRAFVVYRIDSPIVKRSILSYRLSRRGEARGRNNRCNVPALYLDSALWSSLSHSFILFSPPPSPPFSLSLFSFFFLVLFWYQKDRPRARPLFISLSPINPGVVLHRSPSFMRSRAPFCPSPARPLPLVILPRLVLFSSLSFSLFLSLKLSLVLSLPPPFFHSLFLSRGMMDLRGERRRIENNKVGHAIQARMQRNYTPIFLSLEQSRTSV